MDMDGSSNKVSNNTIEVVILYTLYLNLPYGMVYVRLNLLHFTQDTCYILYAKSILRCIAATTVAIKH